MERQTQILRLFSGLGCKVTVFLPPRPLAMASRTAVFLSKNGPGDPAANRRIIAVPVIKKLTTARLPVLFEHTMPRSPDPAPLALGATKRENAFQGHHGAQHPVKDTKTPAGRDSCRMKNHGFAPSVDCEEPSREASQENSRLADFDGSTADLRLVGKPVSLCPASPRKPHPARRTVTTLFRAS